VRPMILAMFSVGAAAINNAVTLHAASQGGVAHLPHSSQKQNGAARCVQMRRGSP
jgi:hypothetical protein